MCSGLAGIGGGAGLAGGELGGDGLADDDAACGFRPGDGGGVGAGLPVGPDGGAVLAGHVGGVEHVLDADRDALKQPWPDLTCGVPNLIRVEVGKRADRRFLRRDLFEVRFCQINWVQFAVLYQTHRLDYGQIRGVVHGTILPQKGWTKAGLRV